MFLAEPPHPWLQQLLRLGQMVVPVELLTLESQEQRSRSNDRLSVEILGERTGRSPVAEAQCVANALQTMPSPSPLTSYLSPSS